MDSKTLWFMTAVLLAYIVQGSIWYTMPFFFAGTFANNYFEIGLLIALIPLLEVMFAVPFGFYADFGKIKLVAFDSMLALLTVPILFAPQLKLLNTVGAFMLAAGGVGIWIAATAYLTKLLGRAKARYIGYELALMAVGWSAGPVLGGFAYNRLGGTNVALIEVLLLSVSSFIMLRTMTAHVQLKRKQAPKLFSMLTMERRIFTRVPKYLSAFLLFAFTESFLSYTVWFSVPLLTIINSADVFIGGLITGIVTVPYIFGDAMGGNVYGKRHEKGIIIASTMASMASLAAASLLLRSSFYSLVILFASTFFGGLAYTGLLEITVEKDRKDSGEIAALSVIAGGLGGAAGTLLVGATAASLGLYASAAVFAILGVAFIAYFHFAFGRFGAR